MQKLNHIPGKWRQTMAAVIMNFGSFTNGMAASWTSIVTSDLQKSNNSVGMQPITADEVSWLVSAFSIGMLLTMLFVPQLCELIGRKRTAILGTFICASAWLLKLFAKNSYFLLSAQLLSGMGDGLSGLTIPPYVTEMASNTIRGRLGSLFIFSLKVGYLFTFILDAVLPYKLMTICGLIPPIAQFVGLLLVPETPVYFIRNNQVEEARRSLMWFRGNHRATVESELFRLEQFNRKIKQAKTSLGIRDLFTDRANLKGLMISLTMVTIQQTSGITIMMMYIVMILGAAETSVNTHVASIIYASVQLSGCWLLTYVVDRIGRRPLLLLSTSGMATSYTILGVFFTVHHLGYNVTEYSWLPILAVAFYAFSYGSGVGPLTSVVANEVFNPELATLCNSIHFIGFSTLAIILTKLFPLVTMTMGFQNCFFIFVATCVTGFCIILVFIPETKGKSIESIREELQGLDKQMNRTFRKRIR